MQRIYHDFDEMISALRSANQLGLSISVKTETDWMIEMPTGRRKDIRHWQVEFSDPEESSVNDRD